MTFEEWWETDTTTWDNGNIGTLVKNACWLAYRAGQEEMRGRASGVAREGQSLHIWAWIRDLPLEGDE